MSPALVMDERGVLCPLPIIHLAQQISSIAVGEIVEVLADDPAAASDIPAWCSMRGHRYLSAQPRGGHTAYSVERVV